MSARYLKEANEECAHELYVRLGSNEAQYSRKCTMFLSGTATISRGLKQHIAGMVHEGIRRHH
eukprot:scaffold203834_cov17-Tisochrysis_lutea.AAC.1